MDAVLTNDSTRLLCDKIHFLIGVPERFIDNADSYDKTYHNIRRLCSLRSLLIARFTEINGVFKVNHSLEGIDEVLDPIRELKRNGISITEYPISLSRLIIYLNENIDRWVKIVSSDCAPIPEAWFAELFRMPDGDTVEGVRFSCIRYQKYRNYYPYQMYINWNFAATAEEIRSKNILRDDRTLLDLLGEMHRDPSQRLIDFVRDREDVVVVTDCENSDAQRLYNSLRPVLANIGKIIFINDNNSNALW